MSNIRKIRGIYVPRKKPTIRYKGVGRWEGSTSGVGGGGGWAARGRWADRGWLYPLLGDCLD